MHTHYEYEDVLTIFFRSKFKVYFFFFPQNASIKNVTRKWFEFSFDVMIFGNCVDSLLTYNENENTENRQLWAAPTLIMFHRLRSVFELLLFFSFSCRLHLAQSKITRAEKHKSVEQYLPNCLHVNAKSYRFSDFFSLPLCLGFPRDNLNSSVLLRERALSKQQQ